MQLE